MMIQLRTIGRRPKIEFEWGWRLKLIPNSEEISDYSTFVRNVDTRQKNLKQSFILNKVFSLT